MNAIKNDLLFFHSNFYLFLKANFINPGQSSNLSGIIKYWEAYKTKRNNFSLQYLDIQRKQLRHSMYTKDSYEASPCKTKDQRDAFNSNRPKYKHRNSVFVRPEIVVKSLAITEEKSIVSSV